MRCLSRQSGFTLVEITVVLVMMGLILGAVIKGYQVYRNSLLQSVFSTMKQYEQAAIQFKLSYRFWPGDFRYATTNLVGCTPGSTNIGDLYWALSDDCMDGNGDSNIDDGGYDGRGWGTPNEDGYMFFRHMALADLVESSLFQNGSDKVATTVLGGFIYARSLTEPGFSDPGLHLVYGGSAINQGYSAADSPILTPREAAYIDGKFDDGRPGFGKLKFRGANGLDNDNAVDTCTNGQVFRSTNNAKRCMMGMRIDE